MLFCLRLYLTTKCDIDVSTQEREEFVIHFCILKTSYPIMEKINIEIL